MLSIVVAALVVLLLFNLVITQGLIRDPGLSGFQKTAQLVLVWLVPFFGGLVTLSFQGMNHSRAELKAILPFPFYLAATDDLGSSTYRQHPHDDHDNYFGGGDID